MLIANMDPIMSPEYFVFVTASCESQLSGLAPLCVFREAEGISAVLEISEARSAGFVSLTPYRMITLRVYSDLQAVGFLAAITRTLAAAAIPCNAVSAFHHDYLFVPAGSGESAMTLLRMMAVA